MSVGPAGVGDRRSNTRYCHKLLSCKITSLELTSTATALYVGAVSRIVRTGVRAPCALASAASFSCSSVCGVVNCAAAIKAEGDGSSRNAENKLASSGDSAVGLPPADSSTLQAKRSPGRFCSEISRELSSEEVDAAPVAAPAKIAIPKT